MYSNGSPLFYTATYGKGSTCKMIVSSANGGYFAVLDPNNNVVYSNPPQPVAPPPTTPPPTTSQFGSGMLASGQVLQEVIIPCLHHPTPACPPLCCTLRA